MQLQDDAEESEKEKANIKEMTAHFFVPRPLPSELENDGFEDLSAEYKTIFTAFRGNMSSAMSTMSLPYSLAVASVHRSHFQRLHTAARIRSLKISGEEENLNKEEEAFNKASSQFHEWLASNEGQRIVVNDLCGFLMGGFKNGLESAAHDLLQQGLVLGWSAFEVLFRDVFEAKLNREPGVVQTIMVAPTVRKRFDAQRLSLDVLIQHGFDLSTRLGTVLVRQNDFSDLPFIKSLYAALYPSNSQLNECLASRALWNLYQRRNLIVHRNAVVDQAYIDATGVALSVGHRLIFTPDDFDGACDAVLAAGLSLLHSVGSTLGSTAAKSAD